MAKKSATNHYFLFLISTIAALGGFLFGYDTGIISGALIFIKQSYAIDTVSQELIVSSVVLGALIGAIASGRLADHYGRKTMLICSAAAFLIGTLITTAAVSVNGLIWGRFIIGLAIGVSSYTTPLFISEMAPAKSRGALVLLNGIMITGGEAISFLVDYLLVPSHSWRLMFATGLVPAALLLIGMFFVPSTPRWMVLKGFYEEAHFILAKIRNHHDIKPEFEEIRKTVTTNPVKWQQLFTRKLWPVLLIGLGLGVLQQFVGINTVMYYGPTIFQAAGFTSESAQVLATFGMGIVNTLMSLAAVLLVDKVGRRRLLLLGLAIAGMSLAAIGYLFINLDHSIFNSWLILFFMVIYIAGYSLSIGSLFWLIIAEIYPIHIRGMAMSFVTAVQWLANFIVAVTFLTIINSVGAADTFWLYGLMCLLGWIFCYKLVPETRGITLEEIEQNIRKHKSFRELGAADGASF